MQFIYSCQDQGEIMHTLTENCSYMSVFSQKPCRTEEAGVQFLMGCDTVNKQIILKLMSNLGCYSSHAGMDD